jgi:hypothetical protein
MTMIASYDWTSDTWTHHNGNNSARQAFRQAVEEVAQKAREALPEANGRIDAAIKIVLQGDLELLDDGHKAKVASQSNGTAVYHIVNGSCECLDAKNNAPQGFCKHKISYHLYKKSYALAKQRLAAQAESPRPESVSTEPTSSLEGSVTPNIPAQFLTEIHGKQFVQYAGLLAMAHERGLVNLSAHFISVNNDIALAEATAEFSDGKIFSECADSTPANVHPKVKPHFPRMALTRAKARCLRDALNISVCSVEEMET